MCEGVARLTPWVAAGQHRKAELLPAPLAQARSVHIAQLSGGLDLS